MQSKEIGIGYILTAISVKTDFCQVLFRHKISLFYYFCLKYIELKFFIFLFIFPISIYSQFFPKKIGNVIGMVHFAVWEEDSLGNVITGNKEVLFQHNYTVEIIKSKNQQNISVEQMKHIIFDFVSIPKTSIHSQKKTWKDSINSQKVRIHFFRKPVVQQILLSFVKRKGIWQFYKQDLPLVQNSNQEIPKRVLIFINGYRHYKDEHNETDNLVTSKDRYHYWYKLDDRFIDTLKPTEYYYLDASMSVKTSNHRSFIRFGISWYLSNHLLNRKKGGLNFNRLNQKSNEKGFVYRREKGRIGGKTLQMVLHTKLKDTLDIVCHSMGYAYSLGIIDELSDKVVLGNIYILSPENASQDGVDWSKFLQVWQYGSNLDQPNPDPLWEQDGIAPQTQVKGLFFDQHHGRSFLPKDWPIKNFIDSHQPYNYDWIFQRIKKGEPGFIAR
jgi:hypothetical protein